MEQPHPLKGVLLNGVCASVQSLRRPRNKPLLAIEPAATYAEVHRTASSLSPH